MYSVYVIQNVQTDKVYIGQSINPAKRWYKHREQLRKGVHCNVYLQRAWQSATEDGFTYYVLQDGLSKEEANAFEVSCIAWFKELNLAYNHTVGGEGGNTLTPENREAAIVKYKARPAYWTGKTRSVEDREKMGAAKRGKKQSPEHVASRVTPYETRPITQEGRKKLSEAAQGNKNFAGKKHTEETLQKMSENRLGEKNPQFGKPTSDKQKQAASATWKGVKRGPMSEETKQKLREARAKQVMKPVSEETKEKIRQAKLARDRLKGG